MTQDILDRFVLQLRCPRMILKFSTLTKRAHAEFLNLFKFSARCNHSVSGESFNKRLTMFADSLMHRPLF